MKNQLDAYNISKSYGKKKILNLASLSLAQGEIVGLLGRNGCGKSTLLKILFGTVRASMISLSVNNQKVHQKDSIPKQLIGFLPQDNFLPKHLKVREVIPLFYPDGDDQDQIFSTRYIEKLAAQKIGMLSIGELRYFELLLVSCLDHPFLLLDEPFSMIEPLYKEVIKEVLSNLKKRKGIILTDHYYEDVLEVSDRALVLSQGRLNQITDKSHLNTYGYLKSVR